MALPEPSLPGPGSWPVRDQTAHREGVARGSFALGHRDFCTVVKPLEACYSIRMNVCDKCKGTLMLERAVDLDAGLAITVYACLNCGRRKPAEAEPRPLTARSLAIR